MIALAGMMLVSCDPALIKGPEADAAISASELQSAFIIDGQFADAECTTPQADGNFIKFHTSPARTVQVFNYKADGSVNVLATGAAGVFKIMPRRGADANQPFHVSTINQDASVSTFDSSVNVFVPGDLAPEVKILTGDSGRKAWKWYTIDGSCWGNAGYVGAAGHGANLSAGEVPGIWWGCTPAQLETEQVGHAGGKVYGYGSDDAYMTFDMINGTVTSYDASGKAIASSPYAVENFDWTAPDGYKMGDLATGAEESGILFPFAINKNGAVATNYEIVYVDANLLTLIANYDGVAANSWSECTWWRFQPKK